MIRKQITIVNKLGLHARAAAKFVALTSGFESEIEIQHGHKKVNGKSIMGLMMLAASKGTSLELIVSGSDQELAVDGIEKLILDKFGEGE